MQKSAEPVWRRLLDHMARRKRPMTMGERLFFFCNINDLVVSNAFFAHRTSTKTWISPDGKTSNEIDYICISQRWKTSIQDVRAYRAADVGSDHHLVRALMRLRLKKLKKKEKVRPFAIEKLKDPKNAEAY